MIDFYISSGACKSNTLHEVLSWARQNLTNVELSPEMDALSFEEAQKEILQSNFPHKISLHHYFPGPLNSFVMNFAHPSTVEQSIRHAKKIISLCSTLKIPLYSLHAGYGIAPSTRQLGKDQSKLEKIPLSESMSIFLEALHILIPFAKKMNVKIMMENNVVAAMNAKNKINETYLFGDRRGTEPILEEFSQNDLGILLDVGHLKVSAKVLDYPPESLIELVQDYVLALHISENNGLLDSNSKIDEGIWFRNYFENFEHLRYASLEVYLLEDEEVKDQMKILKSFFQ